MIELKSVDKDVVDAQTSENRAELLYVRLGRNSPYFSSKNGQKAEL